MNIKEELEKFTKKEIIISEANNQENIGKELKKSTLLLQMEIKELSKQINERNFEADSLRKELFSLNKILSNKDKLILRKLIMRGISLFASSGIGEFYLTNSNIDIVVANELLPKRAELYRKIYPESKMITGDITNEDVFAKIQKEALEQKVEFMIASPPCQGMSVAGKNRNIETMATDNRNYLIMYVIKMIESVKPRYIIIENVPALLKLELKVDNNFLTVPQLLELKLSRYYDIDYKVLDTADFGTPQRRKRAIIRLSSKGNPLWEWPKENPNLISVRDAIGDLPSIESNRVQLNR